MGIGINKKLIAIHQHNEKNKANEILHLCEKGHSIAYISDAGTPAISDRGAFLVNSFLQEKQKKISKNLQIKCSIIRAL